jgi:pimeloyl-ACP methyl ester carboxylesterase
MTKPATPLQPAQPPTPATTPRGRLLSAIGVALAAVGCAPPGARTPESATDALRQQVHVGPPLQADVSYLRAGDPRAPRLILVHGTPGSATAWSDYLTDPPPGLEVVALDRPGFGRSGPEGAMPGLPEQAAAVIALLPADGRPVVLLGHSLGGPVVAWAAAQLAVDQPQRVLGLVLLSASLDPAQEDIHPMQFVGAWAPVRWLLPRVIRNANSELMALKPELEALGALLPAIRSKVVIVHGTQDDLVPVANVPYMQARLTGARCVQTTLLPGLNHFLPWNSAAAVRGAVQQALEPAC